MSVDLDESWDSGMIVVSYVVAVFGSVGSLFTMQHLQAAKNWNRYFILFQAAFSLGGCGVWLMHFFGMNALTLKHNNVRKKNFFFCGFSLTRADYKNSAILAFKR